MDSIPTLNEDMNLIDWKPHIGMKFNSLEESWRFWSNYGAKII